MISRRIRVEEKRKTRKAVLLFIVSVALLLAFVFVGAPFLAKVASVVGGFKENPPELTEDKIAPAPPSLEEPPPLFVKTNKITLAGRAEIDSTVRIFSGERVVAEIEVGETSRFSVDIPIADGPNYIWGTATDKAGNESERSSTSKVVFDLVAPELAVQSPEGRTSFSGSEEKEITISGLTELEVKVTVNERLAIIGSDGSFSVKYSLLEGENVLNVSAEDPSGNKTEKILTISWMP